MDAIEYDQADPEISPFQQICARHGAKVNRYRGCPKCVVEEVRRHERRIAASLDLDLPLAAEFVDKATAPQPKIR